MIPNVRCRLEVSRAIYRKGRRWRHGELFKATLLCELAKFSVNVAVAVVLPQDIYGVMYKPFDFDPAKSYPIVAYVYPGPQTEGVMKSFGASPSVRLPSISATSMFNVVSGNGLSNERKSGHFRSKGWRSSEQSW